METSMLAEILQEMSIGEKRENPYPGILRLEKTGPDEAELILEHKINYIKVDLVLGGKPK